VQIHSSHKNNNPAKTKDYHINENDLFSNTIYKINNRNRMDRIGHKKVNISANYQTAKYGNDTKYR
jgi:hypothetical protein